MYKAAVAMSPVGEDTANALKWTYQPSKVTIPIMVVAGTKNDCISDGQLRSLYSHISATNKAMAIRKNTNHPEMLYSADGYVTAWFMLQLQSDEEAEKAFVGDEAEILKNTKYQDVAVDNK